MRLRTFFALAGPALTGQGEPGAGAKALGIPAAGWALYARFCDIHRHEVLAGVYSETLKALGPERHAAVARDYFTKHPCNHWDLNANAETFPAFLAEAPVPAWVAELADLEWWMFRTFVGPDHRVAVRQKDQLAGTVVLRRYRWDVVTALQTGQAPAANPGVVMLWRDAGLKDHMRWVTPAELVVIKAVVERVTLEPAARAAQIPTRTVVAARARLVKQGVVVPGHKRPTTKRPA